MEAIIATSTSHKQGNSSISMCLVQESSKAVHGCVACLVIARMSPSLHTDGVTVDCCLVSCRKLPWLAHWTPSTQSCCCLGLVMGDFTRAVFDSKKLFEHGAMETFEKCISRY